MIVEIGKIDQKYEIFEWKFEKWYQTNDWCGSKILKDEGLPSWFKHYYYHYMNFA